MNKRKQELVIAKIHKYNQRGKFQELSVELKANILQEFAEGFDAGVASVDVRAVRRKAIEECETVCRNLILAKLLVIDNAIKLLED